MYLYVYIDIPIYLYTYIDIPIYLYTYIVCQLNCDVLGFHRSQKGAAACAKRLDISILFLGWQTTRLVRSRFVEYPPT